MALLFVAPSLQLHQFGTSKTTLDMLSYRSQLHKIAWREITRLPLRCFAYRLPTTSPDIYPFWIEYTGGRGFFPLAGKVSSCLIAREIVWGSIPHYAMLRPVLFLLCCPKKKNSFLTKITKLAQN